MHIFRQQLSSEKQLIYLISRTNPHEQDIQRIRDLLTESVCWKDFQRMAQHHQIFQFLHYTCNNHNLTHLVPAKTIELSRKTYYLILSENTTMEQELLKICTSAKDQGFSPIAFRGFSVIHQPCLTHALRFMADIDLLIEQNHLLSLSHILSNLGYHQTHTLPLIKGEPKTIFHFTKKTPSGKNICIEPHLRLAPSRPNPICFPKLHERLLKRRVDDKEFLILSKEDLLLSIALHLKRHCQSLTLKLVVDAAEMIHANAGTLQWDYIIENAKNNRMLSTLYLALYLTQELLDAPVPREIIEKIKPHPWIQQTIHMAVNKHNFLSLPALNSLIIRACLFDSIKDFGGYLWQMRLRNNGSLIIE